MNKELSTKLVYIDYKTLLAHYKEPTFWEKTWCVYDYGGITVNLGINVINCRSNNIVMGINCYYKGNKRKHYSPANYESIGQYYTSTNWTGTFDVPINRDDYTNEIFQKTVYQRVIEMICSIEKNLIWNFSSYKAEKERIENLENDLAKLAKNWLDDKGVEDDDIRSAYISSYTNACLRKSNDYRQTILDNNNEKVLTKELMLFASFNKNVKDYEKYKNILETTKVSKSIIRTWVQQQKDEAINWESMLPSIQGE